MCKNSKHLVVESGAMKIVERQIDQIAKYPTTVLLTGETGVGKNYIAKKIVEDSSRSTQIFRTYDCGGMAEELVESDLFGHNKGAFTHAIKKRRGFFEATDRGTLFIDEIGELSPKMQAKFLRVIEEGELERMGGTKTIKVNVRVIAATNRNLEQLVKEGKFRRDLYYRLKIFPIHIPPLRERRDEIPKLVTTFIDEINGEFEGESESLVTVKEITEGARKYLQSEHHLWEGNVRQLRNAVEAAMIRAPTHELKCTDFHIAESQDLSETRFDRLMSITGTSEDAITEAYVQYSDKRGGRGPQDRLRFEKTMSALLSEKLTVAQLSGMKKPKLDEMGYVATGSIDRFIAACSETFFGKTYKTVEFIEQAIKIVKEEEENMADNAIDRENGNEPL